MTSDTESVTQTSCTAFIKQSKKRSRQRKPGSRSSELPESSDDYGFLKSRHGARGAAAAAHSGPQRRRRQETAFAEGGEWRLTSDADGSIASSGSIPITLGSLGEPGRGGGGSSQCCSLDDATERPRTARCGGSRSNSPWSDMSIHIVEADEPPPPPPQPDYGRRFDAAETIGKYYCRERRSRSAGPARRGGELTFYPAVRDACGVTAAAAAASRSAAAAAASYMGRSKSECRTPKTTADAVARSPPSPRSNGGGDRGGGFGTRQSAGPAERPSRSLSRRRGESAASVGARRCSSKSREIIALYTRSTTPGAAAAARPSSCTRASSTASTSTLVCGGGGGGADYCGGSPSGRQHGRAPRSKSAFGPSRCSDSYATSGAGRRTASPAGLPTLRSRSQPRPQLLRGASVASSGIGFDGAGGRQSGGSHAERRQRSDSVSESLRLWARSASRSTLSTTPRDRRGSGQKEDGGGGGGGGGARTPQPYTAVLEMDKDVNARVEALLNHGNSLKPADVRLMAIAGYKPADDSWASEDEVSVEAGTVVVAKYKQCEWVYVTLPDGREGFMPYAYTKPIKAESTDARRSGPPPRAADRAERAVVVVAAASPLPVVVSDAASPARCRSTQAQAARARASPDCPSPRPRLSLTARQPPPPHGAPGRRTPSDGAGRDGGGGALVASTASNRRESPAAAAALPAAVVALVDPRRCADVSRQPRFAGASRVSRFGGQQASDSSSVVSSDNDSVFYESAYATVDFDAQSATGSERTASALSTPSRLAAALASDYGNAAFFSDSGISETPSSDVAAPYSSRWRATPTTTLHTKPRVAAAVAATFCGEHVAAAARSPTAAAYAYTSWCAGGGSGSARRVEEREERAAGGGGGRDRRRERGDELPSSRVTAYRRGRPPSDVRDRARAAGSRGGSLCPEMTRDYDGPTATVVYDYERENEDDVGARAGESVRVLNEDDPQWLWVQRRDGSEGFLPRDNALFLPFKRSFRLDDRRLTTTVVAAV